MLIFNNKLSVSPITKHISIDQVSKNINKLRNCKQCKNYK